MVDGMLPKESCRIKWSGDGDLIHLQNYSCDFWIKVVQPSEILSRVAGPLCLYLCVNTPVRVW